MLAGGGAEPYNLRNIRRRMDDRAARRAVLAEERNANAANIARVMAGGGIVGLGGGALAAALALARERALRALDRLD